MVSRPQSVGHPVDVASGTLYSEHLDVSIPGRMDLAWQRRYSTALLENPPGILGPGWTSRYFATLTVIGDEIHFTTPEGAIEVFYGSAEEVRLGRVVRNLGAFMEVQKTGIRYTVTRWNVETGSVERFILGDPSAAGTARLMAVEDATGDGLDLEYDHEGRLAWIRQRAEKRQLVLKYGPQDRLFTVSLLTSENRSLPLVRYEYDRFGRLVAAYDAAGSADRYEYDNAGRMVREVRKDGGVFSFRFDPRGRCIHTSGLDRYDEKALRFFDSIRCTEVVDSRGGVTCYQCLPTGQVSEQIDAAGVSRKTEYDVHGRITGLVNANGAVTSYEYDEFGNRCATIDPLGNRYQVRFNASHLATAITDPAGHEWRRSYDNQNRLVRLTDPLGGEWQYHYDNGLPTRVVNPAGAVFSYRYSSSAQLLESTDWEGNRTRFEVDDFGRVTARIDPAGDTTGYSYDLLGRIVKVLFADQTSVECEYDASGNLSRVTDANGNSTRYRYGSCRRLVEKIDAKGNSTKYCWSTEPGLLESISNPAGENFTFLYDSTGRKLLEEGPDGRKRSFTYDHAGFCITVTNSLGERIALKRDPSGRIVERIYPDGTRTGFKWDYAGNLLEAKSADCLLKFELDPLGAVIREAQDHYVVSHSYDDAHRVASTHTSLGFEARYTWDKNGLLSGLTADPFRVRCTRSKNTRTSTYQFANNLRFKEQYDGLGRTIQQEFTGPAQIYRNVAGRTRNAAYVQRNYHYANNGSITNTADSLWGKIDYEYDEVEQLIEARSEDRRSEDYAYDRNGNISLFRSPEQEISFEYAPGNRLRRCGTALHEYDAEGRLIRKVVEGEAPGRAWSYEWDCENRLRKITTPDGQIWEYRYDPLGRRISKVGPAGETRYVWDGDVITHEVLPKGCRTWIYDPNAYTPLGLISFREAFIVLADQLGTARELVDDSGAVVWASRLTAWGELAICEGEANDCPVRFPGQWYDEESGLHYNRNRYYDPKAGRYISPDPIGLLAGPNVYRYATNPVSWIDPLGLDPVQVDPNNINFSQRTVTCDGPKGANTYQTAMEGGKWDWNQSGPLRVMEVDGQLVSYDNRRLVAAQRAGLDSVPVEIVNPDDIMPGSNKTWGRAFQQRRNDPRNVAKGGAVPEEGVKEQPECA